jgi:hypothetical protein
MENGDKNEREKLVVVVIDVVVLFVLSNKKPFGPIYIFKHVLKNNFVLTSITTTTNFSLSFLSPFSMFLLNSDILM